MLVAIAVTTSKESKADMLITKSPMLIEVGDGNPYYILPSKTVLHHVDDYDEGHSVYKVHFYYKGDPPADEFSADKENLICPLWLGDIDASTLKDMFMRFPLSKEDVQSIIKVNGLTKADLADIIRSLPD